MVLTIDLVTLFPGLFKSPLKESLLEKAQAKGFVKIRAHDLRDWTYDRHKTADDKPFGGGAGMVMKPEPIFECVEAIGQGAWVVLLDSITRLARAHNTIIPHSGKIRSGGIDVSCKYFRIH